MTKVDSSKESRCMAKIRVRNGSVATWHRKLGEKRYHIAKQNNVRLRQATLATTVKNYSSNLCTVSRRDQKYLTAVGNRDLRVSVSGTQSTCMSARLYRSGALLMTSFADSRLAAALDTCNIIVIQQMTPQVLGCCCVIGLIADILYTAITT